MIAAALAFLKANKVLAITVAAAVLILAGIWMLRGIYTDGKKAGAGEVINAVQEKTIKDTEAARKEKAKADEKVRDTPIDSVIDSLR